MELNGTKAVLSTTKIDFVKDIGFSGMDIKIRKYTPWILAYLVSNIDPTCWVQCISNGRTEKEYYMLHHVC